MARGAKTGQRTAGWVDCNMLEKGERYFIGDRKTMVTVYTKEVGGKARWGKKQGSQVTGSPV